MRKILLLFICFSAISGTSFSQKENTVISSKPDKVTVFLQNAQVERSARQALPIGKYNIVFNGISPKIDKQSIQVKAEGKLTILSVTHQLNYLKEQQVREEIKQLELQKEQIYEKTNTLKNLKNVYAQEEKMLLANQSIKGETTLKASELKEAVDFQRLRLSEIYQKLQETENLSKKSEGELKKIETQLSELNQKKNLATSEIIVAVDVKESNTANFNLSYLVKEASWFPTYDIRVTDISHPIDLITKANITQQSGEDWKDVKLFLSNGNPNENGTKPTLSPWYLKYYYPSSVNPIMIRGAASLNGFSAGSHALSGKIMDERGIPLSGATISFKGTSFATTSDASGNFAMAIPAGSNTITVSYVGFGNKEMQVVPGYTTVILKPEVKALDEVIVVGYGLQRDDDNSVSYNYSNKRKKEQTDITTTTFYQPTTTVFEIKDPYSVPDDGKTYTVDINRYELNAAYEYYSIPKLDPSAYLTAKITDWQELNLLPGEASLFFEGTYLGNSFLDVLNSSDTLNISLGKDKGVVVKRTILKEFNTRKFLGSNKTESRQYEIIVRNNKQQPVKVIVEDQFPISTNKEIEVDKLTYDNAKLDEDTKKVIWNLTIESKKEARQIIGYVVKYPKDKILQLE